MVEQPSHVLGSTPLSVSKYHLTSVFKKSFFQQKVTLNWLLSFTRPPYIYDIIYTAYRSQIPVKTLLCY